MTPTRRCAGGYYGARCLLDTSRGFTVISGVDSISDTVLHRRRSPLEDPRLLSWLGLSFLRVCEQPLIYIIHRLRPRCLSRRYQVSPRDVLPTMNVKLSGLDTRRAHCSDAYGVICRCVRRCGEIVISQLLCAIRVYEIIERI